MPSFARARAYLESLPAGAGSLPQCRAKHALLPIAFAESRVQPEELADLGLSAFLDGALVGAWIPEVVYVALSIGIADVRGYDDEEMRAFWKRCTSRLIEHPLYAAAFRYLSPRMVVMALGATWSRFHEGSTVTATNEQGRLLGTMRYRAGLHPPLIVFAYAGVLEAVAGNSSHFEGRVHLETATPTEARYVVGGT